MDIQHYLKQKKAIVDNALVKFLPSKQTPPQLLNKALRYTIFSGGKRLRPILSMATIEAVGGNESIGIPTACAIELIHNAALIHDDLPCMDNDDYRRGKLSSHKVFGEAIAVLTGDALLNQSFGLIARHQPLHGVSNEQVLAVIQEISHAVGIFGLIGGQIVDIQSDGKRKDLKTLEYISSHKTAGFIMASVRCGAIIGNATEDELSALTEYGHEIGMAFQIVDDILDTIQDKIPTKTACGNRNDKKITYVSVFGVEKAKELALNRMEKAIKALETLDLNVEVLIALAKFFVERSY